MGLVSSLKARLEKSIMLSGAAIAAELLIAMPRARAKADILFLFIDTNLLTIM